MMTPAAMAIIMLPAMEKLSTQAAFFFSARHMNTAMTAPETRTTASGSHEPPKPSSPPEPPEMKPPI